MWIENIFMQINSKLIHWIVNCFLCFSLFTFCKIPFQIKQLYNYCLVCAFLLSCLIYIVVLVVFWAPHTSLEYQTLSWTQMKCVTLLAALWQFYTGSDELHTLPLAARTQPEPWFEYWGVYRSSIQIQSCSLMNTKCQFNVLFDRLPALAVHAHATAWRNDRTVSSVEMKVSTGERESETMLSLLVLLIFFYLGMVDIFIKRSQVLRFSEFWTKGYIFIHEGCFTKWKGYRCSLIPLLQ